MEYKDFDDEIVTKLIRFVTGKEAEITEDNKEAARKALDLISTKIPHVMPHMLKLLNEDEG